MRLVPPEEDVDEEVCALTGVGDSSGLGDSSASMGDGDAVDGARGESDGAGITVTTAEGDGLVLLGAGDGLALALGLCAGADRDGVGSGGMTPVGELDGSGAFRVLLGVGFGVLLARAVEDAFGVGDGAGAAEAADPTSTAGVTAAVARPSSSGRRTSGTR